MSGLSSWLTAGSSSDFDASTARNIFTTLFLVLNFLIVFIGGRLIKRQGQRQLLKYKPVPVTRLTPWLSLGSTFSYIWSLRALPGGFFGLLMIASGIFSTANRYIVNSCIISQQAFRNCTFEGGLVTNFSSSELKPVPVWPAAFLAFSAHDAALINDGEIGIYSKINNNITTFYPTEDDVLGNWNCTQAPEDSIIEPQDWVNGTNLQNFINRQSFLPPNATYWTGSYHPSDGNYDALMAWAPYVDPSSNSSWHFRATIATPASILGPVNASNLDCKLEIQKKTWNPAPWPINDTLTEWRSLTLGFVLDIDPEEYSSQLTKVLNAMSMVAGSGNHHFFNITVAEDKGAGPNYGCLVPMTLIYNEVFIITLVLIMLALLMLIVDLYDIIRNTLDSRHRVVDKMPFDLLDWQLAVIEKMTESENLTQRKLTGYEYYWNEGTGTFECRKIDKKHGTSYQLVENPAHTSSGPSISKSEIVVSSQEIGSVRSF